MRVPAIALLLLVLATPLAGCAGLLGADDDTPAFAPGVTEERVTDAAALADAHRAALNDTSYEYVENYTQRVDAEGYHYAVTHDTRTWVAADGAFLYWHRAVVNGTDRTSEYVDGTWSNGTVAVTRTVNVENATVTYRRYRPPEPYTAANATRGRVAGTLSEARVAETWNESGREFARVWANDAETKRMAAANGSAVNATTVHSATATVREDGFVPKLESSLTGRRPLPVAARDGTGSGLAEIHDAARVRYSALGSTRVPRPAWVDDALAATRGLPEGRPTDPRPANGTQ